MSDVLAAVMRHDPDWTKLPASTPMAVRRLLRRCLEKAPRERLHDIADARLELDEPATDVTGAEVRPSQGPNRRTILLAAAGGLALFIAGWLLRPTDTPRPQPVRRFDLGVTKVEADVGTAPTMSPDGTRILYRSDGRLWVRRLDQLEPQELEATRDKDPRFFFWSPDGSRIGFVSDFQPIGDSIRGGAAFSRGARKDCGGARGVGKAAELSLGTPTPPTGGGVCCVARG